MWLGAFFVPSHTSGIVRPDAPMDLIRAASAVASNAYAPYSNFPVGATVQTSDGSIYLGTNMENASYGLSICAEVGALQSALANGKLNQIARIAIVGGRKPATPCGRCRQLLYEAAVLGAKDIEIWCANEDLTSIENYVISHLLPHAFGPQELS
jgi:cytidine deaminase